MDQGYESYADWQSFYEANDDRRRSAEIDFGSGWMDAAGNRYRITWLEQTREVLAVRLSSWRDNTPRIQIVAQKDCPEVRAALGCWTTRSAEPDSLSWALLRLTRG